MMHNRAIPKPHLWWCLGNGLTCEAAPSAQQIASELSTASLSLSMISSCSLGLVMGTHQLLNILHPNLQPVSLIPHAICGPPFGTPWALSSIARVKFFLWKFLQDAIPVGAILHRLWDVPTDCWVRDAPSDIIEHCFTVPWLEPRGFNHLWEFKSTISMMSLADILLNLWEHFDENQIAFCQSVVAYLEGTLCQNPWQQGQQNCVHNLCRLHYDSVSIPLTGYNLHLLNFLLQLTGVPQTPLIVTQLLCRVHGSFQQPDVVGAAYAQC